MNQLQIGALARHAGLTVRALHHYDSIGLLSPGARTASGARRYGQQELIRLHRIQVLKQLGCSLKEIQTNLDDSLTSPVAIIQRQISVLRERARQATDLSERLQHVAEHLIRSGDPGRLDWLELLEMTAIYERHLTGDEVRSLRRPKNASAADLEAQWGELVSEVRRAMKSKLPPQSVPAQTLAWRWVRLVIARTSNNPMLAIKLRRLQERELRAQQIVGISAATLRWIGQAIAHARVSLFAKYMTAAQTNEIKRRQLTSMRDLDAWPRLVALVREQMAAGTLVDAKPMRALALRWQKMFRDSFCGSDAALEAHVRTAFAHEPDLNLGIGVSPSLMKYIHAAIEALPNRRGRNHASTT
jgi:DNA-binding transcriptional MerR regulator